jgi:hypothetical protein
MMYVMRNTEGKIIGVFALSQEGFAEESLSSDDEELIEFLTPKVEVENERSS